MNRQKTSGRHVVDREAEIETDRQTEHDRLTGTGRTSFWLFILLESTPVWVANFYENKPTFTTDRDSNVS